MENNRDDLVVILAGYKDRMEKFFQSNPGMSSRIAHHIDFPDYSQNELIEIAKKMVASMQYQFDDGALKAVAEYIDFRQKQPHFANARSIRNALDRARLRHANRVFELAAGSRSNPTVEELSTITEADIRASRVFEGGLKADLKVELSEQTAASHEERR